LRWAVDDECQYRRDQQHHADDCTHLEVLLADDLLVDIRGQHVEVTTDHLGCAEIRDRQRKHHERRADETVAASWNRHGEENAQLAGAKRHRRLVEP
jgi:hypothetical protein